MPPNDHVPSDDEVSILVLWSPGVGQDLAHRLVVDEGLPLLRLLGDGVRVVNHCGECGSSDHGRPLLVGLPKGKSLNVSISYADDVTLVALNRLGPVGVDVECEDASAFADIDQVAGHEGESEGNRHSTAVTWVRKESLLKATGQGLTVDPRELRLTGPNQPPELITWDAPNPPNDPVWMYDLVITSNHVAAVTVLAAKRPQTIVRRVDLAASRGQAND